jgi:GH25 family lysozyme M1 (1,4-beta-N-acetylmuramidase)
MLTGVDVSHHQGEIAWPQVRAAGYDFMLCKVTQGLGFEDARWRANRDGARAAGLVPGCYHFLERDSGGRQARRFAALVGDPAGHLVALDAETPGARPDPTYADVLDFADEWRTVSGGHPLLLYTGRWWWVGHLGDPPAPASVAGLWNSQYNDAPFAAYGGWQAETIRQHTSAATVPGVAGSCDANRFAGTPADLLTLTGPQEELTMADAQQVLDALARLRQDLTVYGTTGLEQTVEHSATRQRDTLAALKRVEAALATLAFTDAQLETLAERLAPLVAARVEIAGMPTYTTAGPVVLVPGSATELSTWAGHGDTPEAPG